MGFRYDIQGLRALAVLLVFIFHLNPSWLSGGFVGVDVFFVISGYLVSSIILHKKGKNTFSFKDFYISRIKRIIPVFYVFLLVVGLVGLWVYLGHDIKVLRMNMFHAAIFNSNNYLSGGNDYFGASSQENPLLHTWTLSLEMQFYFLLPLFLIFIKRKWIIPACTFLIIGFFAFSFYNSTYLSNQSLMYFSLLARIPEFLIGVIFAMKADFFKKLYGKSEETIAVIALVGLVVVGIMFSEYTNFPGLWVILPCVFAGILLTTTDSKVNMVLSNNVLVHIGELSYSIYLWHWAIMAYIRYYFGRGTFYWYEVIVVILGTYVLSWLSYTFIENVLRKYDNKKFVLSFGLLPISLIIIAYFLPVLEGKVHTNISPLFSTPTFGEDSHASHFKAVGLLGSQTPSMDSICLIGDSHTLAYKAFFDEIGLKNDLQIKTVSRDNFPLIGYFQREEFNSILDYNAFNKLQDYSSKLIKSSKFIFISSEWKLSIKSMDSVFKSLVEGLRQDQKIIIVGDYPLFESNFIRKNRSILKKDNKVDAIGKVKEFPEFLKELIESSDQIVYMPLDYTRLKDLPYINDTIAYYDGSHLNAYGSRKLADYFANDVRAFLLEQGIIIEKEK